jgi:hypothetical protein
MKDATSEISSYSFAIKPHVPERSFHKHRACREPFPWTSEIMTISVHSCFVGSCEGLPFSAPTKKARAEQMTSVLRV